MERVIDVFSIVSPKTATIYSVDNSFLFIVAAGILMVLGFTIYIRVIRAKRVIADINNLIRTNKNPLPQNEMGYCFKDLTKEEQKDLISQGMLLTLPMSLGLIITVPFFFVNLIKLFVAWNQESFIKLVGAIIMSIGIYAFANRIQKGFLHQLVTNRCRITKDNVIGIKEDEDKTIWIKSGGEVISYNHPVIQFVTTENFTEIPTLYKGISSTLLVGSKVYVVHLDNGEKYILEKKCI